MKLSFKALVEAVSLRANHVFMISGNIYDTVYFGETKFRDTAKCIESISEKKFTQMIVYDLFSGIRVVRGSEQELRSQMGIKKNTGNGADNDLVQALRGANMIQESEFPKNPSVMFQCFDKLLTTSDKPTLILIEYSDAVFSEVNGTQNSGEKIFSIALTKWSRNEDIRKNGHIVILSCRNPILVNREIRDRAHEVKQIRINKPTISELEVFFTERKTQTEEVLLLAKLSVGLSLRELAGLGDISTEHIFALKKKVLTEEYGDLLRVLNSSYGFDAIGGMKKQITELKAVAEAMRTGDVTVVPQGVMLVGPPGTGKTLVAQAFSKEAGVNCVSPLNIKNMFVGKSEERMEEFLEALKDLMPVVVFIDEFDQNQNQRGSYEGDSGVSKKIFQKMLEAMSDTSQRGKILWMLASNRPDLIDPAIKRPGRCDLRIPFLPPNIEELELICKAAFVQYPEVRSDVGNWSQHTKKCAGYNGSDMIEIVLRAWRHARRKGAQSLKDEDVAWAISDYIPQRTNTTEIARMSVLALLECSSQSLLPDNWKNLVERYAEIFTGRKINITAPEEMYSILMNPSIN